MTRERPLLVLALISVAVVMPNACTTVAGLDDLNFSPTSSINTLSVTDGGAGGMGGASTATGTHHGGSGGDPNAGLVACGAALCDLNADQFCCPDVDALPGLQAQCRESSMSCLVASVSCDGPEDCGLPGWSCCAVYTNLDPNKEITSIECKSDCKGSPIGVSGYFVCHLDGLDTCDGEVCTAIDDNALEQYGICQSAVGGSGP